MGSLRRAGIAAVAVVSLGAVAAGCDGGNDPPNFLGEEPATGLTAALGQVRDTDQTRGDFQYADVAALRALTGGGASGRFARLIGTGYSPLATAEAQLSDAVGFDPGRAEVAIATSQPPTSAGVLLGSFDADAVDHKLSSVGGRPAKSTKEDGGTLITRHGDDEVAGVDGSDPLVELGIISALNEVFVSPTTIAYGSNRAALAAMRATGSDTLAHNAEHRAVARCLGDDVTVADITRVGQRTSGVGVRARSTSDVTELWCLTTGSADEASQTAARIRTTLASGTSQRTQLPWSALISDPKVEVQDGEGNVVRVSAHVPDGKASGVFLQMLQTGELDTLAAG